jgi:hypothetical protein
MKFKDEQRLVFELFELVELVVSSFDCSTVETAPTSGEGYRNSSAQSSHQQEQGDIPWKSKSLGSTTTSLIQK